MAGSPPEVDAKHEKNVEKEASRPEKSPGHAHAEANAGKDELAKTAKAQLDYLKHGGKSGITNEFGKPVITGDSAAAQGKHPEVRDGNVDPSLDPAHREHLPNSKTGEIRSFYANLKEGDRLKAGNKPEHTSIGPYEEWDLKLKPNHIAQSPDGGSVHADNLGRIDWIQNVKGEETTIQYVGDTTQPANIRIGGGTILTWHGEGSGYGIPGQEGKIDARLDQQTGIIKWSNRRGEETRHFPSGGTENEDGRGRVTSIIDANGRRTEFQYDQRSSDYPSHIKAGFDTGGPITEFDIAGDGKKPLYYYDGNPDLGGGSQIAIAVDRDRGDLYTLSFPNNYDITNYQQMNTLKVVRSNGQTDTVFDGDPNFIPQPIRVLMGAAKIE